MMLLVPMRAAQQSDLDFFHIVRWTHKGWRAWCGPTVGGRRLVSPIPITPRDRCTRQGCRYKWSQWDQRQAALLIQWLLGGA